MKIGMRLRDYQQEMLDRLYKAWGLSRSVMVQMPTGTGKTVLLAEAIKGEGPHHVLVVAHRRELIEQIKGTLADVIGGDEQATIRVESIQKLGRNTCEVEFNPSLVIVDEAHHALAKTYQALWKRWPKARFLGLTATPCRLNGSAFTDLFDVLLQSWSIQEFIDKGYLSDFEYVSARPDSTMMRRVHRLQKRGADGDYQTKEMATVLDVPESIAHLYDTYRTFARGRKGIVYAIDRRHAGHIAMYYQEKGVKCCVIESQTPARERKQMVEDYRAGRLDVLVNVDIFSEGFDCPEVEFIQLARPTLSLAKYLQQVGRGMRVSEGKPHVLILDNVGLYQTFGLPTDERDWRQMFYGKLAGKGAETKVTRCIVADGGQQEKELVNLEMVYIKSSGQRRTGLEVFLQDGHYGVMRNGRVTCPARFKQIDRLEKRSGFFALAIYTVGTGGVLTTVIDNKGKDMHVKLPGIVSWENGYFCGVYAGGTGEYVNCWDPVGNSYYYGFYPEFRTVAGVEVAYATEHHSDLTYCNKLRFSTGKVSPRFDLWEMFYNRWIIIARDYLVIKSDHNHSYRICGYLDDSILVQDEDKFGYQQFFKNGRKGIFFTRMPAEATQVFIPNRFGLQRVEP